VTVLSHLGHHHRALVLPVRGRHLPHADAGALWHGRVYAVQRLGAVTVGLVLMLFGLVGLTRGLPFLESQGQHIAGLSSDGLLSVLSVVVAVVLLGAAARGPRVASTVMIVLGVLFLLSALVNGAVLESSANLLAFQVSNVVFSVVVGLLLLLLGAYGRISGHLPDDSPYAHPHAWAPEPPEAPSTAGEAAAEAAMREAEHCVVQHTASEDQRRRVQAMAQVRTRAERRRTWMSFDQPATAATVDTAN
jgi:Domain of unknown function (DUF4383)